ncbi:MAG: carbonic anhydrase [Tateyamaria sp.]|uniref:carbonic anhydrase n=1 Tax=Tateyamaria sp. TaxID=1929288 RepID=UPI0032905B8E
MHSVKPLPTFLLQRYQGWKATTYAENSAWYRRLANEGQRPRTMVISCCDSRVHVTSIFGADQGEFFIHRNIANLVPPFAPGGDHHGTSAAVEYAVTVLEVAHVVVLGHSRCGGVQGCVDMCEGRAPELEEETSFVGRWMDILRPKYEQVADIEDETEKTRRLEQLGVVASLENLMTFPFVEQRVNDGTLSIHGLWTDIAEGTMSQFVNGMDEFQPV